MQNFIRELVSDAKDEYGIKLFRRILVVTLSLGLVVVVLLSVYNIRQSKIRKSSEQLADTIFSSFHQEDKSDWYELLKKQSKDIPLAELGKLRLASLNLQKGLFGEALKILQDINSKSSVVGTYTKLTLISIYLDHKDLIDQKIVESYISKLSEENIPFDYSFKVVKSLYLIDQKQTQDAQQILSSLLDDESAPKGIQMEARSLLHHIESKK